MRGWRAPPGRSLDPKRIPRRESETADRLVPGSCRSYFEVAIRTLAGQGTFDQVRRSIVDRARDLERNSDLDGSFDEMRWDGKRKDIKGHANNAVDVLKEMMTFGWLKPAPLPSSPTSAYLHIDDTDELLAAGRAWAELVNENRRDAYGVLTRALMDAHPQFEGFLRAVGALPFSTSDSLTIPLWRRSSDRHRSEDVYLDDLLRTVGAAVRSGQIVPADADDRQPAVSEPDPSRC